MLLSFAALAFLFQGLQLDFTLVWQPTNRLTTYYTIHSVTHAQCAIRIRTLISVFSEIDYQFQNITVYSDVYDRFCS